MKSSRSLDKLFEEAHDELAILVTRTRQLKRLTREFRSLLDQELASHCYIGKLETTTLCIYVDSAAWATRLRFQVPQLIPQLQRLESAFSKLERIQVKILTQHEQAISPATTTVGSGPVMSFENANAIKSLSNSIEDPALQQALQRLARHAGHK